MTSSTLQDRFINPNQTVEEPEKKRELGNNLLGYIGGTGLEVGAGYATDLATYGMLGAGPIGWAGYAATNFASGAASNWAAQKLRGEEEISWGEIISSGLIDIIPFFGQKAKGITGITKAVGVKQGFRNIGGTAIEAGARTAAQRQGEIAIDERRWLTPRETLEAAALGGAFGGTFRGAGEGYNFLKAKYKKYDLLEADKLFPPDAVDELVKQGRIKNVPKDFPAVVFANRINKVIDNDPYYKAVYDRDPEDVLFTTPNPKSFKKDDVINWNKDKVLKRAGQLEELDETRRQSYLVALEKAGGDPNKIQRSDYESYSGATRFKDVEETAQKLNEQGGKSDGTPYTIADVVRYFEYNDYQVRQINAAKILLNNWGRRNTVDKMKAVMEKYAKDRKVRSTFEYRKYQRLVRSLDNAHSGIWTIGHKDAIKDVFMRGEFGGNRISNLFLEPGLDSIFTLETGKVIRLKGNIAKQNLPIETNTLVNLAGGSWDLTDDFLKVIDPKSLLIDQFEGLRPYGEEYIDVALQSWEKLVRDFLQAENISIGSKDAKLASEAITSGLVAWFRGFNTLQDRGVGDLVSGLRKPITIVNAEDYWYEGKNTIGPRSTKNDLERSKEVDLLDNLFLQAFNKIWKSKKTLIK